MIQRQLFVLQRIHQIVHLQHPKPSFPLQTHTLTSSPTFQLILNISHQFIFGEHYHVTNKHPQVNPIYLSLSLQYTVPISLHITTLIRQRYYIFTRSLVILNLYLRHYSHHFSSGDNVTLLHIHYDHSYTHHAYHLSTRICPFKFTLQSHHI